MQVGWRMCGEFIDLRRRSLSDDSSRPSSCVCVRLSPFCLELFQFGPMCTCSRQPWVCSLAVRRYKARTVFKQRRTPPAPSAAA